MQKLTFNNSSFKRLRAGKSTTIRLGIKSFELAPVSLLNNETQESIKADIIEIRHVRFCRVGLSDAISDGFNCEEDLIQELERCYKQTIDELAPVTIVRFKVNY